MKNLDTEPVKSVRPAPKKPAEPWRKHLPAITERLIELLDEKGIPYKITNGLIYPSAYFTVKIQDIFSQAAKDVMGKRSGFFTLMKMSCDIYRLSKPLSKEETGSL